MVEISLSGSGALVPERASGFGKRLRLSSPNVLGRDRFTDSASDRATRTGDANKDVRNRRIRLVPSNNPDHKTQVL